RSTLARLGPLPLIVLGDSIQQGHTHDDDSGTGALIPAATLASLQGSTSYISYRRRPFRKVLKGEPIILIEDGRLLSKNLRRERMTPDDLAEEMRTQQIAAFDQVQWAILESNGTISFIPKAS